MIRLYHCRRFATGPLLQDHLCDLHVERRKTIGWRFVKELAAKSTRCFDCEEARTTSSVLDTVIAADDAAKKADEPPPVPVLKGQRKLFE